MNSKTSKVCECDIKRRFLIGINVKYDVRLYGYEYGEAIYREERAEGECKKIVLSII